MLSLLLLTHVAYRQLAHAGFSAPHIFSCLRLTVSVTDLKLQLSKFVQIHILHVPRYCFVLILMHIFYSHTHISCVLLTLLSPFSGHLARGKRTPVRTPVVAI